MKKYLLAAAAGAAVIAAPVQAKSMKCAAVSQAKAEGLVELAPHRGSSVVELTDTDADALFPR